MARPYALFDKVVEIAVLNTDNKFPKLLYCIGECGSTWDLRVSDQYHGATRCHLNACASVAGACCPPSRAGKAHRPIIHVNISIGGLVGRLQQKLTGVQADRRGPSQ
jgi:hypothetical protein